MKRWIYILGIAALLLLLFPVISAAETPQEFDEKTYEQQRQSSGADGLMPSLPEETQDLLRELGIEGVDFYAIFQTSPRTLLNSLLSLVQGKAGEPLRAVFKAIGILLLLAVAQSFVPQDSKNGQAVAYAGAALLIVSIVAPLSTMLTSASAAVKLSSDFMLLLIPALAAVITASGNPLLALSYNSFAFAAAQSLAQFSRGFLIPFTGLSLATGIAGTLAPELKLQGISQSIQKCAVYVFGSAVGLFSALLSLRGIMANTADSLAVRGIKLVMKSAVPIVGGALSEAYASIAGSLTLLKTAVGIFGILAIALINLPILLELILWIFGMKFCAMAAQLLDLEGEKELLQCISAALTLLAVLVLFTALLLILATGITVAIHVDQ